MRALLDAGVNVSLATKGCGSIETADMLKAVTAAALLKKLRDDDPRDGSAAEEAWGRHEGGAHALGRDGRWARSRRPDGGPRGLSARQHTVHAPQRPVAAARLFRERGELDMVIVGR